MRKTVIALAIFTSFSAHASITSIADIQDYIKENNIDNNQKIKLILQIENGQMLKEGLSELTPYAKSIEVIDQSDDAVLVKIQASQLQQVMNFRKFSAATLLVDSTSEIDKLKEKMKSDDLARLYISFKSEPPLFTIDETGNFQKLSSTSVIKSRSAKMLAYENSNKITKSLDQNFSLLEKFEIDASLEQINKISQDAEIFIRDVNTNSLKSYNPKLKLSANIIKEAQDQDQDAITYTIQLKTPEDYTFASQFYSLNSSIEQDGIFSSILQSVIENILPGRAKDLIATTAGFGMISLTKSELKKLIDSNDPRISSIEHNKNKSLSAMAEATGSAPGGMNLAQTWSANQGSNAWIAIMDTGVKLSNPEISDSASRQFIQGCFNTNDPSRSISGHCLTPNSVGDTPNLIFNKFGGYSDPCVIRGAVLGGTTSSPIDTKCEHGNAVASAALGNSFNQSAYRGVSFGSNIFAINFMSLQYNAATNTRIPTALSADYAAALNAIKSQALSKKIVINISQQSAQVYNSTCDSVDPQTGALIRQLRNQYNTPTIISTGNAGSRFGISWPSCIPGSIKAASTFKDTGAIAGYSNMAPSNSSVLMNQTVWLAPVAYELRVQSGGFISSMYGGNNLVNGTSFAAPLVSGAYALVRSAVASSVTVDEIDKFMNDFFPNVSTPVSFGPTTQPSYFKRLRLSN